MDHLISVTRTIQLLFYYSLIATCYDLVGADPPYNLCPKTTNYSADSPFEYNLKNLFNSLTSNASVAKLFNTSAGKDSDRVYGQYMCYNYVQNSACIKCIKVAAEDAVKLCPRKTEAVVWEEDCQLRYSNENFLGRLDITGNLNQYNPLNISEPERYRSAVKNILSNLTEEAAFDPSTNMYATGKVPFTDPDTLYAMVQCTRDLSADDCNKCLQTAIANISSCCYFSRGARLLSRSCYLRYELYAFYQGVSDGNKEIGEGKQRKTWILILAIVMVLLILLAVLAFTVYRIAMKKGSRKRKSTVNMKIKSPNTGDHNRTDFYQDIPETISRLKAQEFYINLETIRVATENFSDANMLGQGGFGSVYKGILGDGKEVAVKRLSTCSEQGTEEFTNEVLLILKLQHKNLVRLLGFCIDGEEKLLVYEFMPNSSLDVILFDPRKRAQLSWRKRLNIVNGIAKGILYLHEDSLLRIIHRDLKASNALLDSDMNPKISDFGMARIFSGSEGEANTARIVGTYGYMAPEYAMEGLYSVKSDVFSFGVLLLEIITGRRNTGFHKSKLAPSLVAYAWQQWNEGNALALMDPLLSNTSDPDEFLRYFNIGLLCVQEDAFDRPTMSSVVVMLKGENITLRQPERPAFSVGRFTDHYQIKDNSSSSNRLTVSDILPR